jgi:tetratricopeptide (TPR) repeat protein
MEYTYSQFEGDVQHKEAVKSPRKWKVLSKKFGKATAAADDRHESDEQCRDSPDRDEKKVITAEEKEVSLLNDKGNEFFVRGEFNGALRMYSEALKLLKNPVVESEVGMMDMGMRRFHIARLLVNIGAVHIRRECYEDAISSLELSIRSSKLIPEKSVHYYRSLEVLSDALENLGLVYYKEKDLDLSLVMYNDALDARRACLDTLEKKWKSRLMKSKDEVQKIKEERFVCKMELASTLQQIALLEERQGNIAKAIERCEEAVAIRKEFSPDDTTVDETSLTLLSTLGRLYSHRSVGWFKEALNNFQKVYVFKSKLHDGEDHIDIVPSLNNIAYVHGELGDYRQCLKLSNRAIDICTTGRGISKESVAAYTNKGYALFNMGENPEALAAYKLALDILCKCSSKDDLMGANLHQKMAEVYMDMGHVDDAITSLENLIEAKTEVLGGESKELAVAFRKLGDCYEMANELTLCIKCHTRSLRIYKHHNDKEGAARQHNKIAGIHKKKGNREKSIDHYMAALWHSREAKLPSTDPTVADTIKNVAAYQNSQSRGGAW